VAGSGAVPTEGGTTPTTTTTTMTKTVMKKTMMRRVTTRPPMQTAQKQYAAVH
jgi:hypothetical protein